ncbi:hypothetical protein LTR62_003844 [Meristemomyces frigidus]|uniref:Spermine/spermidine synthase n=1 Tax=Meristemomyces frigidus TaxID=1508187 RepID=A0AAN7TFV2_9PEZI|nr:hypothetical protein LTR62_003844 [Meristemomyces frigidus]
MAKGRQQVRLPQQGRKTNDALKKPTDGSATEATHSGDPLSPANIQTAALQVLPLLALAALVSSVSQATLSPVYGSIPVSINHLEAITATVLLGFIARHLWRDWIGDVSIQPYLTLWAFWIPIVQMYLTPFSQNWGPVLGAVITGLVCCHTLLFGSGYAAAQALEGLDLRAQLGAIGGVAIPALVLDFLFFRPMEYGLARLVPMLWTWSDIFSPTKLLYVIACGYGLASRPKPYWLLSLGIPSLIISFMANPHFDASPRNLEVLNEGIAMSNWTVLERQWSNTGYISVVENSELSYRALRCDHSLLGGEWLLTPERKQNEGWQVSEPIYAVFSMLEAVRLIETHSPVPDNSAKALVIGLGIGTAPKALLAHGINTTIVELDPVVHKYATKYFALPTNHNAILTDAVTWVDNEVRNAVSTKYNYIIHDVFTGGAEPLALFTTEFLNSLRSLLTPEGTIAINYAGDLTAPLTTTVLHTIQKAFDNQCRIFRDAAPAPEDNSTDTSTPLPKKKGKDKGDDFLNLVLFCRNFPSDEPLTFRSPVNRDFLGSRSRAHYLLPKPEWEISLPPPPSLDGEGKGDGKGGGKADLLKKGDDGKWRKAQEESAIRHWYIMRGVLPEVVWEMW